LESTIVGMEEDRAVVYRLGSIDLDELSARLGYIPEIKNQNGYTFGDVFYEDENNIVKVITFTITTNN
jgi:hypothetical protein